MRRSEKELDVDFIGGLGQLSREDKKAISEYIQGQKRKSSKRKARLSSRTNTRKTAKV